DWSSDVCSSDLYGHVEGDLPRPFDDVAPSVSEGRACGVRTSGTGGAKRGGIEPFKRCGLAERDGLTCYRVGAQRAAHATADVQSTAQYAGRKEIGRAH